MAHSLENKEEFKKILKDYSPSQATIASLKKTKLALLSGPTNAGRNTMIKKLIKDDKYEQVVSHTTRPKRQNKGTWEQDGREYWFINENAMLTKLQNGKMLEASIIHDQQVSGISVGEIERITSHHHVAINEVEPVGADNIVKYKPDTVAIFVVPPNFEEWLSRIQKRGGMSDQDLRNRFESALWELQWALDKDYYHIVVNEDIDEATQKVAQLIETGTLGSARHIEDLAVIDQLIGSIKLHLA